MRPVIVGNGNTYKAQVPQNFDFSRMGNDKRNLIKWAFNNQVVVSVNDCLNYWLQVVKDKIEDIPKKNRTPVQNAQVAVKNMIVDKVTDIYKLAGVPMVQTIGDFCCYCDSPVPGLLEVEHVCPKSQYPTYSMEWSNFQVSCGPCNNTKRDNPDRDTVAKWSNPAPQTEQEYVQLIVNHYLWASFDAKPYDYVVPVIQYYDTNQSCWVDLIGEVAFNTNNILVCYDLAGRVVKANLYNNSGTCFQNIQVRVVERAVNTGTMPDIINLCGLNDSGNPDSTYDRRLINRTKAWLTALATIKPLMLISPLGQQIFDMLWLSVLITAASTGFYSVWAKILNEFSDPSGVNLRKRFVLESNKVGLFPGTNTSFVQ